MVALTILYAFILITLVALLFVLLLETISKSMSQLNLNYKLPPGTLGWPYIGETLQLYSQDPTTFFTSKQKRYGEIFKTHILGYPCVMLSCPEASKFVLVTQSHLFKPTYPKSKERLIGPSALFFHQGNHHARLRKLVQASLSLDSLRTLVSDIHALALSASDSWTNAQQPIATFHEMKKYSFEVGVLSIFGHLETHYSEVLKKNYSIVDKGYNSFPNNIPGTAYSKAVSARQKLSKVLSEIIAKRKEKRLVENDLLGYFLESRDDKGELLKEEQIADNIIGVLFAAQDTTASVITWILKYLHDEPKLLEAVKAEQMEIRKLNEENGQRLTWKQTRNMPISYKVVLESLRMASIISFTFREAVADVEYKGYLIPKGWKVMPLFRNIHHNPEFFSEPQKFDPSRFDVAPKANTFVPFGSGTHACPGNELAKLEILVMVHHLVTHFRWELIGSESGVQYSPFPVPSKGLPAKFWRESI